MDPKWQDPKPSENNKRFIDSQPYTRNTVTNRWDKVDNPGTGASGNLTVASGSTAAPPQQSA